MRASQSTHSRIAQRIASQKRMLSSVIVTFKITLTIKRSIRKPAMTDTTVTTCGVTIFEISQMTPITMESRIASSIKRVQEKRRTCLREVGCCLILSLLFDASALTKAGVWTSWFMMIVFISELLIVSRAITRCAGYTKTSVCTNSWRVERSVYLGSWHYKSSRWCYIKSCSHYRRLAGH